VQVIVISNNNQPVFCVHPGKNAFFSALLIGKLHKEKRKEKRIKK
jgi:hypothetical protein